VDGNIYNPAGYRAYRDAIYLNGARFLEELRELIGEEVFFDFISAYARKFSGHIVTGDEFFALLDTYNPKDITPLLDKYFLNR